MKGKWFSVLEIEFLLTFLKACKTQITYKYIEQELKQLKTKKSSQ